MTTALYTFSFVDKRTLRWLSTLFWSLSRAWLALPIRASMSLYIVLSCEMILPSYLKFSTFAKWVLLMVITGAVLSAPGAGWCKTSVFSRLIVRPKSFADWEKRRRSNRKPSRRYRMYTPFSRSWTAWAIMHVKQRCWRGLGPENIYVSFHCWFQKALLHLHRWEPNQSHHHEIAEGSLQISVGIKIALRLSIEPSCWWCRTLLSSRWRQSRAASYTKCTFLIVVSWQKSYPLCFGLA